MEKRNRETHIIFTDSEYRLLCRKAREAGLSRSAFIRRAVSDKDYLPVSIEGENQTGALRIKNVKDGSERTLHLDCVFIAVGVRPLSSLVKDQVELTAESYVLAGEDCRTSVPGVFVAGDLRRRQLREILTACADGANAAVSAAEYLSFTEGQEGREAP